MGPVHSLCLSSPSCYEVANLLLTHLKAEPATNIQEHLLCGHLGTSLSPWSSGLLHLHIGRSQSQVRKIYTARVLHVLAPPSFILSGMRVGLLPEFASLGLESFCSGPSLLFSFATRLTIRLREEQWPEWRSVS